MSIDLQQSPLDLNQVQGVFALYSTGQFKEALDAVNALLREHPGEGILHNLAGLIHAALLQYEPAIEHLRRAAEIRPDVPDTHFFLGTTFLLSGDPAQAVGSFARAIEIRPDYLEAHSKLCEALERSNRLDEMQEALERAKDRCGEAHPALALRDAELLKRRGQFADARERLEGSAWQAADDDTRETAAYLLSDLCDRLDAVDEAFAYADEANRITRATLAVQRMNPDAYFALLDEILAAFAGIDASSWQTIDVDDGRDDPVFLVGFPRSGTTLLNTILQTHGAIEVVEEVSTVYRIESEMREAAGSYGAGLAGLDTESVRKLRRSYFDELDAHFARDVEASVIVDKLPLNIVHAGLIQRVFPGARFLFAQRHPCDAVLSCYMRNFAMNEAMVNCTELARAAKLYDRVMTLWEMYRDRLPLAVHTVRYESLIADFDATLGPVLEFLGVEWDDGIRDYMETDVNRGRIGTPSYNQVTQALYSEASGRWQRYRAHLEPVLPDLLPWAEKLGYTEH